MENNNSKKNSTDNVKLTITKKDFLNFSQKNSKDNKVNNDNEVVIEMTNLDKDNNDDSSLSMEQIETNLDDIDLENLETKKTVNNDENEENGENEEKEESTYLIPKHKMITYLQDKNKNIQDKQTIYEYYYESLNAIYSRLSICLIIISSIVTLLGSAQLGDVYMSDTLKYIFKIAVILFSFIITVLSSVKKFQLYKEKIESIGKYMEQLDILIDDINILIQKIELTSISDQEFFKQLQHISIIVTRTNTKLFNIRSDKYYKFYKKLKLISSKKWNIQHEIKTQNETKYNEFLKKRLETMEERLELKTKFKVIDNEIKKQNIDNFYKSDLFSYSKSTENHEE